MLGRSPRWRTRSSPHPPSLLSSVPHAIFERPFGETTRGPTVHRGNPGTLTSPNSAEFLLAKDLRRRWGVGTRRLRRKPRTTSCLRHTCQPLGKNLDKKYKAHTHLMPHHDASCMMDMEVIQQENFGFYHASTRSPWSTSTRSSETYAMIRGAVAHIPSKRTFVTAQWKRTKSTSIA